MSSKTPREELARIVFNRTGLGPFPDDQEFAAADDILAAGYARTGEVSVPAETLRLLIHWAVKGGAENGLFTTRKALSDARAMLEGAAPQLPPARDSIAAIIREHWVEGWDHPHYASAVRCMKGGCGWEGQFPGDIADHCAELISGLHA